jgi:hypothetical protein
MRTSTLSPEVRARNEEYAKRNVAENFPPLTGEQIAELRDVFQAPVINRRPRPARAERGNPKQ